MMMFKFKDYGRDCLIDIEKIVSISGRRVCLLESINYDLSDNALKDLYELINSYQAVNVNHMVKAMFESEK